MLLISPTSVTGNWQKEAARFTPELPVLVHHGTERKKGPAFAKAASQNALVVSSYALLARDLDLFKAVPFVSGFLMFCVSSRTTVPRQCPRCLGLRRDDRAQEGDWSNRTWKAFYPSANTSRCADDSSPAILASTRPNRARAARIHRGKRR